MRVSDWLIAAVAVLVVAAACTGCGFPGQPTGAREAVPASQRASDTVPANCAFRAGLNECDKEYDA